MRAIEVHADRLARNARQSMRDCALSFRRAKKRGDALFSATWLTHAKGFRDIARGYKEAA
jgi:hypothetical protein